MASDGAVAGLCWGIEIPSGGGAQAGMPSGRKRVAFGRNESCEEGASGRPPLNGVATRFVQDWTLSLSLKRFDAVGNRNPALRTLHPDEVAWSEPTCVIKSVGFEGEHVLRRL